jgi:type VI secretion system Vgr family protein
VALTQSTRIATLNTPLGGDTLVFHSLSISEELGRLFTVDIEAGSESGDIKADDLLGRGVSVEMQCPRGGVRYFHGFVSRFSRVPRPGTRYFVYRLTAVPWLWFLTRHSDCRIFQNKTLQDILRDVFGRRGFSDFKLPPSGDYTPWDYCVQYRETDFNFVSRLLEQEGVYYYFEHEKEKHTAVFADSPAAHQPFPKYEKLTFSALTSMHPHAQEHVYDWVADSRHHSGKYLQTDYDFTNPNGDLKTPASNPGNFANSDFEIFDYPGEYDKRPDGEQWSRVRMEELCADRETFEGGGDVTGLATGRKFTLSEGPSPADVGEYLVIASSIHLQSNIYETGTSGDMGETYHCTFTAIKAADQFRPARITPKPAIQGLQTAVVTGPKGEEIYTDKYGRIKVQFHWDREGKHDENTTCWIRVATTGAGQGYGRINIPRIGQEVVVGFLEGDPDQPLVVSSVYNAKQMPPYGLPSGMVVSGLKSKTHKGAGYNEMSVDDTPGNEKITIHGQYDMNTTIENNQTDVVHNSRETTIDVNHTQTIGAKQKIKVGANRELTVGGNSKKSVTGKEETTIGGKSSLAVGGKRTETIAASHTVMNLKMMTTSASSHTVVAGTKLTQTSPKVNLLAGSKFLANSGGKMDVKAAAKLTQQSGAAMSVKSGAALKMQSSAAMSMKSGAAMKSQASGAMSMKAGGAMTQKGSVIKLNSPTKIKGTTLTVD